MNARNIALVAAAFSAAMLLGAFGFQFIGGLAPCKLCIWQRWPHGLAAGLGIVILLLPWRSGAMRWLYLLGASIVLFGAGVAFYHTGVEQHWWLGPTTCSSQPISGLSTDQLMDQIFKAPLVRCDDIPWSLFGLSMAAWNFLMSMAITGMWLTAFRHAGHRAGHRG